MTDSVQLEDLPQEARVALPHNHPILDDYADRMGAQYGLPTGFLNALKNSGERSNSNQVSPAGAQGVMQIMPSTQKALGVTDPTDPLQSIRAAAQYNAQNAQKLGTSDPAALAAAYHAGPASKAARGDFTGSPITKRYADAVAAAMPLGAANAESGAAAPAPGGVDPADLPAAGHPAAYDPTQGMSGVDKFLAGTGKFFSDTGSGLRQLAATAVNPVARALTHSAANPGGVDAIDPDYAGEAERARLDGPLMDTGAGLAGNMFGNAVTLALPGAALGRLARAAVPTAAAALAARVAPTAARAVTTYGPVAASAGALSALAPTTQDGERAHNMALGAALSPALQAGLGGLGSAAASGLGWAQRNVPGVRAASDVVGSALTSLGPLLRGSFNSEAPPGDRQSVARAVMNNIPVYPQQLNTPGTEALSRGQIAGQNSAFTRAVNSTMGQATEDTPGAIAAAHAHLGDVYSSILDQAQIPLTPTLGQRAAQIHGDYLYNNVTGAPDSGLEDATNRLIDLSTQGRTLTGRQYQDTLRDYAAGANRARLTSLNKGAVTNTPDLNAAAAYRDLSTAVQDHAEQFLPAGGRDAFAQANRQWRNMSLLQSVAPVANGVTDYSPTALARKLKVTDPNGFWYDQGDTTLPDLAKFGTKFMGMEANAPTSITQRIKQSAMNSAPILAGDAAGALLAGDAMSPGGKDPKDQPSAAGRVFKGLAAAALTHGALTAANRTLNPRVDLNYLNAPRGALAELASRINLAPAVAGAVNAEHNDGDQ